MKLPVKLLLALLLFASFTVSAQKLGHINSAELLQAMPEKKAADTAVFRYSKVLRDTLDGMTTKYQAKVTDYTKNQKTMPDAVKKIKADEINDLQNRIQQYQNLAQQELRSKNQEVNSPVLQKASDAIKAVAKENGYAYIFDVSGGSLIYTQDSDDIMDLVKKKLGLK